MRIAFDHQIFGWQEYGGIARYFYEIARILATTSRQEVTIIAPLHVNRYLTSAPEQLTISGISIPKLPKTGRLCRVVNAMLARPMMRRFRPDIVHETYYASTRLAPKGARVALTVYDMIHERFKEAFSPFDPTSREKALAVERADHVICISAQTQSDLVELFGVDPAKTSVVHLGFTLTSQSIGPGDHPSPGRPFLLYVGNRWGYKNFEMLLQVFAAVPTLRDGYDLICFGGGALTQRECNLIQRLGIPREQVQHISGSDSILADLYRTARAFIYPSLYEGFGLSPLEAMSFDCPVACSGVSSIPEVVGDAAELFDPTELDSMSVAIMRVVDDENVRQHLISRGRERIKQFSWTRCAQETLDVYRRLLS